ncbi:MAG: hypothetical protein ACREIR_03375, partial [Geminicoccaceae bacterium]
QARRGEAQMLEAVMTDGGFELLHDQSLPDLSGPKCPMKTQQQSDVVVPASQDAKQYARHRPDGRVASGCAGKATAGTLGEADQRPSRPAGTPIGAQDGPERCLGRRTDQAPRPL